MSYIKPDLNGQFAENATAPADIEEPQTSTMLGGWLFGEKPPHKWFNWLLNKTDNALSNLNERGVLDWDTVTIYNIGSMVWSGGKVYRSRTNNNTNIAVTNETNWQEQSLPDMPASSNATYALVHNGSKLSWVDFKTQDFGTFTGATTIVGGISFARSESAGIEPIASEVPVGGIAINLQDKIIYSKKADGTIIPLVSGATRTPYTFYATAGQTSFAPPIGYTVNFLDAYINGRRQTVVDDYTANDGTNVVFHLGLTAGDTVVLVVMSTFQITDAYTKNQTDAFISQMKLDRAGVTFDHAGATAPTGSLPFGNAEYLIADYPELYAVVGDIWATTGGRTAPAVGSFRVPPQDIDGLGLFTRGTGIQNGVVGTYQADVFKSHNHTGSTDSAGGHIHNTQKGRAYDSGTTQTAGIFGTTVNAYTIWQNSTRGMSTAGDHTHTVTVDANGDATETRPRSITMLKCIWTGK